MNPSDYTKGVLKTESVDFPAIRDRVSPDGKLRLLHAGMGLVTESGEFLDALKKHTFYGKPVEFDSVNAIEEIGDILWYAAQALDELGSSFEEAMTLNNKKLAARYENCFSSERADVRDLDREREILEGAD